MAVVGGKPEWLKRSWRVGEGFEGVASLVGELGLNTVCREASCPNLSECFGRGTATFMILGSRCTRDCGFCGVAHGAGEALDLGEPFRVAEAVRRLALGYVVVTSVTRDDLPDGGAGQFARVVRELRRVSPGTRVEVLIPDFGGDLALVDLVAEAGPDVISHNMETVRGLYGAVRKGADYGRSLAVIARVSEYGRELLQHSPLANAQNDRGVAKSKSGVMVGLGETEGELFGLFGDLRGAGCAFLTIGQYLRPSAGNVPVAEYVEPERFERLAGEARARGFEFVAAGPFVRSSYHAEEAFGGRGK